MEKLTGEELVQRWLAFVRRYVALTDGQALTVALWALNTWIYERFYTVPYLEIWASGKRSGKTTLAEVLKSLVRGGRILPTVRVLSMVKLIEREEGAYVPFIEEAEAFHTGKLGETRGILASGYRRGAVHELEKASYSVYCPKAFVLIGNVHHVIRDRCISIKLDRHKPERTWTNERYTAEAEADDLVIAFRELMKDGSQLDMIKSADGAARFHVVDPIWLKSARDRELWTPLFSLAHALRLHKATIDLLTRASVDLSELKTLPEVVYHPSQNEKATDDGDAADSVLRDLASVLQPGEKFIPSGVAVLRLHGINEASWRAWRGDGLNAVSLSALLGRFGLETKDERIGKGRKGSQVLKCYSAAAIRAALAELDKLSGK